MENSGNSEEAPLFLTKEGCFLFSLDSIQTEVPCMNLIFLNTMEKKEGEGKTGTAQVSIQEHQGVLQVIWSQPAANGKLAKTVWYEGQEGSWSEMLLAFRDGIRAKMREGFFPLVEGFGQAAPYSEKRRNVLQLHYYAEKTVNPDVLRALKQWRAEQARKEGKAAYMVATNRILHMIGAFLPHHAEELLQIPGFGEARSANYGTALLEITANLEREHHFPLNWVTDLVNQEEFLFWCEEEERKKEHTRTERAADKKKLLEAISHGGGLTELEAIVTMKRRELVLTIEELEKEGYDMAAIVEEELKTVDPDEQRQADILFQELGDRYLKPVVNKLYSEQELQGKDMNRVYEWLRLYRMKFRRQAAV
jgi:hypothetical protein